MFDRILSALMWFFEKVVHALLWLRVAIAPILLGLVIGGTIYFKFPGQIGFYAGMFWAALGFALGTLWAEKVRTTTGLQKFATKRIATPDLDLPRTVLTGRCRCGNAELRLEVTHAPRSFGPRACDCDFCLENGAQYLSDAAGFARINLRNPALTEKLRHGSEQAEFLKCTGCDMVIGAFYTESARTYGALNVALIDQ